MLAIFEQNCYILRALPGVEFIQDCHPNGTLISFGRFPLPLL